MMTTQLIESNFQPIVYKISTLFKIKIKTKNHTVNIKKYQAQKYVLVEMFQIK